MKILVVISFVFIFSLGLKAQTTVEETKGTVSFLSSQSVYVKYETTNGIAIGDTLFTINNNELIPSLVVKNLSSSSVVCRLLSDTIFQINDVIIAKRKLKEKKLKKKTKIEDYVLTETIDTSQAETPTNKASKQELRGRFTVSSYSYFSNTPAKNSYVINYSSVLNIKNISNSKFSLESNILFRQENDKWSDVQKDVFNGLKIYGLAVKYKVNKSTILTLGRKINSNLSSLGSIDGLQAEKSFKNFFTGVVVGTRPDNINYGFNANLLQYGGYFGHKLHTSKGYIKNSLAVVEQTNNAKTDRRFLNFQHRNSLIKNVHVFYTLEADFYQLVNNVKQSNFSLTNNYLSLRYQPFRRLRLSGTYDTRKNIIYYETYKNYLSTLIAEETRQGYSVQLNYQIAKRLFFGIRAGYRHQKKDKRITRNAYAYVRYNNMFKSSISATLSSTILETIYLNGNVYNIRFSRPFNAGKTNVSVSYSFVNYRMIKAEFPLRQHIANINISKQLIKKLSFSMNFEVNKERNNQFYRLYLQLRKRF